MDLHPPVRESHETTAPGRDPVRIVLATMPLVVVLLLLALVLRYSALHLANDDTWFHLVLGDRFRHGASLTHPAGLTPFATSSWVPTQWSTEVLASLMQQWFGVPGVAWLFGGLYAALVLATYVSARRLGRPLAAALVTCLVVFGAAPALSARPQIVSLLLLTVTVGAWLRTAEDGRLRWWLVPMTWVWATAHGLWSAGVLVGVVCWLGIALDRRFPGRRTLLLLAVPVLSVLAAALTPVGPRLLTSQLAVSARTSQIAEWGPTSFRTVPALAVALMIALLVVLWIRQGQGQGQGQCQRSWARIGLLLLAGVWALTVTRMVGPAGVLVAPMLAEAVEQALVRSGPVVRLALPRVERAILVTAAVVYLVALAVAVPHAARGPEGYPDRLVPRLEALPRGSTVLVEDGIGGWLEWQVPAVHPEIDGMLDAYPVGYIRDFFAATRVEPGWRAFVSRTGARVAVVDAGSPLTAALEDQAGWRRVARDRTWVYLEAPSRTR